MIEILPDEFFNIKQPYSTFIDVQFRKDFTKEKENPEAWQSINFDGRNELFESMNFSDSGGIPQVELKFIDKKMSKLENIIIKSIVGLNIVNSTYTSAEEAKLDPNQSSEVEDYMRFHIDDTISSNIRIKFGYNENRENVDLKPYQSPQKLNEFKQRKDKKDTIYRTPWLYFKILDVNFNINEYGLVADVKAISVVSNILDKAKLWRRNAVLTGTPMNILIDLQNYLNDNMEESFVFEIQEEPLYIPPDETTEEERSNPIGFIELSLGGEPTMVQTVNLQGESVIKQIASFKSLKSLLNELCTAVFPKYYKNDGSEFSEQEIIDFGDNQSLVSRASRYSYYYEQDGSTHKLIFKYQDPGKSIENQTYVRNYLWRSNSKSIVKNVNIESKLDFALINAPIVNFVTYSDSPFLDSIPETDLSAQQGTQSGSGVKTFDKDQIIEALNSTNYGLVAGFNDISTNNITASKLAQSISSKVINNIANGMFSGTLEIPGDPYYLFDSSVEPFVYLIKLTVLRPEYKVNDNDELENQKSYLSGNYLIKNINHVIDSNGFSTTLEISKFPSPGDKNILNVVI